MGTVEEATIENCEEVVVLFEVSTGLEVRSGVSLTIVTGGSRVPTVSVCDSKDISFIANRDAMYEPLETLRCSEVSVFAVKGLPLTTDAQ